jgi:hydrophobic/amphiphilic exporter-1 (mainly G- bacteria), HAE1 family
VLSLLSWLTDISLRRATVLVVVVVALFAAGILAATQIKLELYPDIDFPAMTVVTTYPGASPQDVTDDVSRPMEQAASTLAGLKRMESVSSEGLSILLLEFGFGTDMDKQEQDLSKRLSSVAFPSTVSDPRITLINPQLIPVSELSLKGDISLDALESIAEEKVVPALTKLDGVLQVEVIGGSVPQVDVVLDPDKLRRAGLSSQSVAAAIQAGNTAIPSGSLTTGDKTVPLRTLSNVATLEDLSNLVVGMPRASESENPVPVLLKDVARVSLGSSPSAGAARTDGQPSVAIHVSKSPEANTVQVANRVNSEVKRLQRDIGGTGADLVTIYDQSTQIKNSISGMLREGGFGALFAVIVVFLFLWSFRSTFVTAVSIPLSVIVALLLLYALGFTLNIFTLAGLTIAIGRVIDDSIVVLENIYRHVRQDGEEIAVAVRSAPREVASAITSSTLTTVAVFLPLAFMGGLAGELFRPFGFTVAFALMASLAAALMVVPVLARSLISRRPAQSTGRTRLQRGYEPVLRWSLRHRVITLGAAAGLFVISIFMLRSVPVSLLPTMMEGVFEVSVIAPAGSDVQTVLAESQKVETILAETPGIAAYQTVVGGQTQSLATLAAALSGRGFSSSHMIVRVKDSADAEAVADRVREEVKGISTNSLIAVSDVQTSSISRLQVTASSDDPAALADAEQKITAVASETKGVANITSDASSERVEIAIDVDPNKAFLAGVSAGEVSSYVRSLLVGQTVAQMEVEGQSTPVVLTLSGSDVADVNSLSNLLVGTSGIPLNSIAEVRTVNAPVQISRVDERPAATVNGDIVAKNTGDVAKSVESGIDKLALPDSVDVKVGGVLSQIEESFNSMYIGIGVAIILVYIVMVIFFGSLLEPFVILFSLPLASIGAVFALVITGRTMGLSALIGLLMLVGIVVTNAIVLMDLVKHHVQQGMEPREALIKGGSTRVRPILMTAIATMLALGPLAAGLDQGGIVAAELATVVIGGLFTSTFLTLVVVPVVYSLLTDMRRGRSVRAVAPAGPVPPTEAGAAPIVRRLPRPSKPRKG